MNEENYIMSGMTALNIAKTVIENGYLIDPDNRNEDNSINWNFISADLWIDTPLGFISVEAEEEAYTLLDECIEEFGKVIH
jgi:hypothetical protein